MVKRYQPSVTFPDISSVPVETGVSSYADMSARGLKELAKFGALAKEEAKYEGELAGASAPIARDGSGRPMLPTGLMEAPTFGTSAKHAAYLNAVKANWRTASRAHTITSITEFNSELRTNTDIPWIGDDDNESKIESFDAIYQAWTEESLAGMPPDEQQGFLAHAQTMYAQTRLGMINDQFERQQALQIDESNQAIQVQTEELYQMFDNIEIPPENIDATLNLITAAKFAQLKMFPTKYDGATVQKEIEELHHLAVKSSVSKEIFRISHGIQQSYGAESTASVTYGATEDTHPSEHDKALLFSDLMLHLRKNGFNGRHFSEQELNGFESMFKAEQDRFNAGTDLIMAEAARVHDTNLDQMANRIKVLRTDAQLKQAKSEGYNPDHWQAYTRIRHEYQLKSQEALSLFASHRYNEHRNVMQSHVDASYTELANLTSAVKEGLALAREEQKLNAALHMAFLSATGPLRVDMLTANQHLPGEEAVAFVEGQISDLRDSVMHDYRKYISGQTSAEPTGLGTGFTVTIDDAFVGLKHGELFSKFLSLKLKHPAAYWSEASAKATELRQLRATMKGYGEVPIFLASPNQGPAKAGMVEREESMDRLMELESMLGQISYMVTDPETEVQTLVYPTINWNATETQDLMTTFNYNLVNWGQLSKNGISRLTQMLTSDNLEEANTAVYMMQLMKNAFEEKGDSHFSDAWKVLYSDPKNDARMDLLKAFDEAEYASLISMQSRPPKYTRAFFENENTGTMEEEANSQQVVADHQQRVYAGIRTGENLLKIFENHSDANTLDKHSAASRQVIQLSAAGSKEDAMSVLADNGMEDVDLESRAAQHLLAKVAVQELFLQYDPGRSPIGIWFNSGSINVTKFVSTPWYRDLIRHTDENVKVDVNKAWFEKWPNKLRRMGINVSFNPTTGRAEHDQFAVTRHLKNIVWSLLPNDRTPVEALLEVFTGAISMPVLPTTELANAYEEFVRVSVAKAMSDPTGAKPDQEKINREFRELHMAGMSPSPFMSNVHDSFGRTQMEYTSRAPETEMANMVAAGTADTYAQQIGRGDAQMHVLSWIGENYQDAINSTLVIPGQEPQESSPVYAITTDGLRLSYDASATAAANGVPHYSFIIKDQAGLEYESAAIAMTMPKDVKLRSEALRWTEEYFQREDTIYHEYVAEWPPTVQALVQKQIFQVVNAAMYVDDTWGEEYRGPGKAIGNAFTTAVDGIPTLVTRKEFNAVLNKVMKSMEQTEIPGQSNGFFMSHEEAQRYMDTDPDIPWE